MRIHRIRAATAFLAAFALTSPILPATDSPTRSEEAPLVSSIKDLRNLNRQIVGMADPCAAATVSLISKGGGGAGSGVVVSEDGLILTAAHVIGQLGDEFTVIFPDGTRKSAEALGADFDRDAAMAKITDEGIYPHVNLGDDRSLLRNDWCIALGHPGGYDPTRTPPIRLGRILSKGQFLITDSAVAGGDSGGPLFDPEGLLIGIHSNIGFTLLENRHVPIQVYQDGWDAMKEGKRTGGRFAGRRQRIDPSRPVLGVQLGNSGKEGGVVVTGVVDHTPASEADLKPGDVITKINDEGVTGRDELIKVIGKFKPGNEITVTYQRGGADHTVTLKLARLGDLAGRSSRENKPAPEKSPDEAEAKPEANEHQDAQAAEDGNVVGDKEAIKKLLAEAMKSGQLELTPEQLAQIGGLEKLHESLRDLAKDLDPDARLEFRPPVTEPDTFYQASVKAITPVTRKAAASTVEVSLDGQPAALGTVVVNAHWIVTKDSETRDGKVTVNVDGVDAPAELIKRFPKRDLALFRVEAGGLKPIRWRTAKKEIPLGTLLTSSAPGGEPLGFGLLSVKSRAMAGIGFLGISSGDSDKGVLVKSVVAGSSAEEAGMRVGDIIISANGKDCESPIEFGQRIRTYRTGQALKLTILRGDDELELDVTLGERPTSRDAARRQGMDRMSGELSERTSGFPRAIQHDIPLQPSECGGPLLDLGGRCVGINVSRAGRVKTFAIPAGDLKDLLAGLAPEAAPRPNRPEAAASNEEAELLKALEDIQKRVDAIEQRVRELQTER